jgi:hypothetical protein
MENSGNLKYQNVPVLLNTPSAANLNVFNNTITGNVELVLPKHGKSIPLGSGTSVSISLPNIATKKVHGIDLNPLYPCNGCSYDYGFTIDAKRKQPGVDNDEYYPKMFHVYSKIARLQPADDDGYLDDSDRETMVYNLVALANSDSDLTDLFEVGCKFVMDINVGTTTGVNFGDDELVDAGDALGAIVNNDLDITVIPMSLVTGTTYRCLVFVPYGVGRPNAAATTIISEYGIYVKSLTENWDFQVRTAEDQWNEHSFSYGMIKDDINNDVILRFNYGASTADTGAAADDNVDLATVINAFDGDDVYSVGSNEGGEEFTSYYSTLPVSVYVLPGNSFTTFEGSFENYSSVTVWQQLTADQVYKVFAHKHFGELDPLVRHERGLDEDYVRITLVHKDHIHASMHSASGYGYGEQRLTIYIPRTKFFTKIYDGASDFDDALVTGTDNDIGMLFHAIIDDSYGDANKVGDWDDFVTAWAP